MLKGKVTGDREIAITLEVIGIDQITQQIEAIIDTGFNGYLTLRSNLLTALGAKFVGNRRAELGDGKIVILDVYLLKVRWHNQNNEVLALQADGMPLVGMSLLWGNRVIFDAENNGSVIIDKLQNRHIS